MNAHTHNIQHYFGYEYKKEHNNLIKTTMSNFFAKHYDIPWLSINWIIAVTWVTQISIILGVFSTLLLVAHKLMQMYQTYLETKEYKKNQRQVQDYVEKIEKGEKPKLQKAVRVKSKITK